MESFRNIGKKTGIPKNGINMDVRASEVIIETKVCRAIHN
jgi:hypothetical protein